MSMNQAPENNLPPPSDDDAPTLDSLWGIAPDATGGVPSEDWVRRRRSESDPPPPTGLRLGGDWTRERAALRKQVAECEDHNSELQALLERVIAFCRAEQKYARDRLAQGDNIAHWTTRREQAQKILDILKPVV